MSIKTTATQRLIAKTLIGILNAPDNNQQRFAVIAWQVAEGRKIQGNNPFNIHSWGGLQGQIGIREAGPFDRNVAIFDTIENGVVAAANNLLIQRPNDYANYHHVIMALRRNQSVQFLEELSKSKWSASRYKDKDGNNILLDIFVSYGGRLLTKEEPQNEPSNNL